MSFPNRTVSLRWAWAKPLAVITFSLALGLGHIAAKAATTELFVSDWQTGIALYGFDPVAFFVDHRPRRGSASFELKHAGAVFRFVNEGNRAAFKENPEIYIPRFGGYDPRAVARGSPAPGFPSQFVLRDNPLFFFSSETSKAYFLANAGEVIAAAEAAWPRVKRGLVH
jgi:YHS domain-containing protein